MKNWKKTALSIGSLVTVAALTVGGTLAYNALTHDDESATNVYVVDDAVDIALNEYQRNEAGDAFEAFEQGKKLLPIAGSAQGDKDDLGMPVAENYGDKVVTVKNTGNVPAKIRIYVAQPIALAGESLTASSDDVVHWNWGNPDVKIGTTENSAWDWVNDISDFEATIDDEKYIVTVFTTTAALAPGAETDAVMNGVYLDANVDYDDGQWIKGDSVINYDLTQGVYFPVYAEAVAEGSDFDDPAKVFATWASSVKAPVLVETADELVAALEEGGEVILNDDIQLTGSIDITADAVSTLNLNGYDVIAPEANANTGRSIYAINNYGELTITGEGTVEARGIQNFGTMTIDSDDITIMARDLNGGAAIWNEGDLVINGGTFTTATVDSSSSTPGALNNKGGTVVINNGTFDGNGSRTYAIVSSGEMTINNATVTGRHGAVGLEGAANLIINDGSFICEGVEGQSDHAIYVPDGTTLTINGGTVTASGQAAGDSDIYVGKNGILNDNR